jgi:UDP-GlcNAc:undecaprenyl-phosphate GlcNAc-1-phosphate transferase
MPVSLALALATAVLAWALTPAARALAVRLGAVDHPGPRRIHAQPVPRLGGLAMAAAVVVAWVARVLPGPASQFDVRPLLGLTCAAVPVLALGIADDRRGVGPWAKLALQTCAALTLVVFGYGVPTLTNPFGPPVETGAWSPLLTVAWVLAVTNAINLIDGLDGLATGVVAIACVSLWWVSRAHGDFYVMFLAALLIGACAGFLPWNHPPARVFMGDTGSQFLGLALAALSLLENRKGSAAVTLLLPLVALGIPIFDSTYSFLRRLARGEHVFRGDTGHIHHRLLAAGLSHAQALYALWAMSAVFGLVAVLLDALPRSWSALLVAVLAVVLFGTLEWARFARLGRERGR